METTAGEKFEALSKAEKSITKLQALSATPADRIDDLENQSRRVNLRIMNVPEDGETCWFLLHRLNWTRHIRHRHRNL